MSVRPDHVPTRPHAPPHHREDARQPRARGVDALPPAVVPVALLGDPRRHGRGNGVVQQVAVQRMQHLIGNRATRRLIQRRSTGPSHEAEPQSRRASTPAPAATSVAPLPARPVPNQTGLPDTLKSGVETLSGVSLDDVRVHYQSARPAQVQALAYTQGTEIHVGPGQESHLAHETWHVVQQKQGRAQARIQRQGLAIDDDPLLEREADAMAARALQTPAPPSPDRARPAPPVPVAATRQVAQLVDAATVNLWAAEHNQTIVLDSGNHATEVGAVAFNNGAIRASISEFALNHFCNRHTYREFSFKDPNIKNVNSFWPTGSQKQQVLTSALAVLKDLESDIGENVSEGGGTLSSKKNTKGGVTVGYIIRIDADDASYNQNAGTFSRGTAWMEMFYPEGDDYTYYSEADLKDVRKKLQVPPHNKVLQLKAARRDGPPKQDRLPGLPAAPAPRLGLTLQLMPEAQAKQRLEAPFGKDVYAFFAEAIQALRQEMSAEFKADEIPDYLVAKLEKLPHYYLPTTKSIWIELLKRLTQYKNKPLTEADIPEVKATTEAIPEEVKKYRQAVLATVEQKSREEAPKIIPPKYTTLYKNILEGKLTCNFAADKLFKYQQPALLNSFEVEKKLNTTTQNIADELRAERLNAEYEHFGLPHMKKYQQQEGDHTQWPEPYNKLNLPAPKSEQEEINPLFRPRYAAINFKNHPFGSAPRNDYGLSHMVLKDPLKAGTTFTFGDSFNMEGGPFTISEAGVGAMIGLLAEKQKGGMAKDVDEVEYKPDHTYLDAQIHQDIDLRRDVEKIVVSKVELGLFDLTEQTISKLLFKLVGPVPVEFK